MNEWVEEREEGLILLTTEDHLMLLDLIRYSHLFHFLTWNKHLLDVNIRACRLDEVTHCQGWWYPSSFHESTGQCYHGPCESLRYDSVLLFQVSSESAHRLFFQTNHIVSFLKHFLKVLETPDPWWSFCNKRLIYCASKSKNRWLQSPSFKKICLFKGQL